MGSIARRPAVHTRRRAEERGQVRAVQARRCASHPQDIGKGPPANQRVSTAPSKTVKTFGSLRPSHGKRQCHRGVVRTGRCDRVVQFRYGCRGAGECRVVEREEPWGAGDALPGGAGRSCRGRQRKPAARCPGDGGRSLALRCAGMTRPCRLSHAKFSPEACLRGPRPHVCPCAAVIGSTSLAFGHGSRSAKFCHAGHAHSADTPRTVVMTLSMDPRARAMACKRRTKKGRGMAVPQGHIERLFCRRLFHT